MFPWVLILHMSCAKSSLVHCININANGHMGWVFQIYMGWFFFLIFKISKGREILKSWWELHTQLSHSLGEKCVFLQGWVSKIIIRMPGHFRNQCFKKSQLKLHGFMWCLLRTQGAVETHLKHEVLPEALSSEVILPERRVHLGKTNGEFYAMISARQPLSAGVCTPVDATFLEIWKVSWLPSGFKAILLE